MSKKNFSNQPPEKTLGSWWGKRVLITAGPTREYLDPVRYLSNASSGMMGFALAKAARDLGARVTLVSGPARISAPWGVTIVPVISAEHMSRTVRRYFSKTDVVIGAAAVSDWKFAKPSQKKLKKTGHPIQITLIPNPDILMELGKKRSHQVLVGFALETHRWLTHAKRKLRQKNLDLIVANSPDSVGMNKTRIAILDRKGGKKIYPPLVKLKAAEIILKSTEPFLATNAK
ncbi:MAG: phosphopantothenoylcysteine decarboxylase [Elusimicrobia bacterium]|nr:phosphopantothenoylcysteine decarboxylase [Elusimicrobiota bacterium]